MIDYARMFADCVQWKKEKKKSLAVSTLWGELLDQAHVFIFMTALVEANIWLSQVEVLVWKRNHTKDKQFWKTVPSLLEGIYFSVC